MNFVICIIVIASILIIIACGIDIYKFTYAPTDNINEAFNGESQLASFYKKQKNNKKINTTSSTRKKKIKEHLANIPIEPDDSHILNPDFLKNNVLDYYYSFDTKTMNNSTNTLDALAKKWNFMKEQFSDIFTI